MGKIIGTCGHDITDEFEARVNTEIHIMDFTRDCKNAVSICSVCSDCRNQYEFWGIVLHNKEEEHAWLNEETWYPLP